MKRLNIATLSLAVFTVPVWAQDFDAVQIRYERFLNDDEACVLDLVKRRLGFDDGLAPEATVAAALKLLGFAPDPDAVLKDNLARAAALHGLDAEEDDEDEEPDEVAFAADASVKKKAVSDSV